MSQPSSSSLDQPESAVVLRPPVDDLPLAADGFHLTDAGNAKRIVDLYGDHLRVVENTGEVLVYDDCRGVWVADVKDQRLTEMCFERDRG